MLGPANSVSLMYSMILFKTYTLFQVSLVESVLLVLLTGVFFVTKGVTKQLITQYITMAQRTQDKFVFENCSDCFHLWVMFSHAQS